MSLRLYVGNLPFTVTEQDLQGLFASAGTVESVTLVRDGVTGRARGFGFVEMSNDEEGRKAIAELNDRDFGGRNLTVNEAKPRPERSGGFGGGGGGGRRRSESRW
jgi:cold-inducible RNA-binding protein